MSEWSRATPAVSCFGFRPFFGIYFKGATARSAWRPHEQRGNEGSPERTVSPPGKTGNSKRGHPSVPEREETPHRQAACSLPGTGGQCQQREVACRAGKNRSSAGTG